MNMTTYGKLYKYMGVGPKYKSSVQKVQLINDLYIDFAVFIFFLLSKFIGCHTSNTTQLSHLLPAFPLPQICSVNPDVWGLAFLHVIL